MQNEKITEYVIAKIESIKERISIKDFCELHGFSESKISRFPSKKFIQDLELFDYLQQYYNYTK